MTYWQYSQILTKPQDRLDTPAKATRRGPWSREGKTVRLLAPRKTLDAIETGCRHAQAGAVERMYRKRGSGSVCLVGGGAGRALIEQLEVPARYIENLVLDGLARIALGERAAATASPRT